MPNIIKTNKITHEKPTHKCVLQESKFKTQFKNTKSHDVYFVCLEISKHKKCKSQTTPRG